MTAGRVRRVLAFEPARDGARDRDVHAAIRAPRTKRAELLPAESIERRIYLMRGHKVMLDADLAALYGVTTRVLLQAVKRNAVRFPADFMLQLNPKELASLRSQNVISKKRGGRRYAPFAFTEQGVAMLSSVLRSRRAIQVNIEIMRAFVRVRELLATHRDFAAGLGRLERKSNARFKVVFDAIRRLMTPESAPSRRPIGFRREGDGKA